MRLYLVHRKYYIAYLQAQEEVEKIINEQEKLIQKVLPKSPLSEHEREFLVSTPPTGGNALVRKAEDYAIEMESRNIRLRLSQAVEVMKSRYELVQMKELEIRKSKDIYNMIYVAKWIDGKKVCEIVDDTGYSRSHIYSVINHLKAQLERETK